MSVIKFEIEDRVPYAEGKTFGEVGVYEQINGKVTFAVDPLHERIPLRVPSSQKVTPGHKKNSGKHSKAHR